MNKRLIGAALFLMLSSSTVAGSAAERSPHWAFLVGVDDYSSMTDLKYCGGDQLALQDTLLGAGFREDQVFLLYDGAKESRYKPFKNNIEKQLDLMLKLVRKDDIVLIAFSGHGSLQDKVSYICPADAELEQPEKTMISVSGLYKRLEKSQAGFTLMMVDACRDIPQLPGKRSARSAAEANKDFVESLRNPPRGIVLLTSCEPGEMAQEDTDMKHGVFMHFVLEGLKGNADGNVDGKLSVLELYEYASLETGKYVARKFNDSQHPQLEGRISGNYHLATLSPTRSVPQNASDSVMDSLPKEITSKSTGMKLMLIPAGEFTMGTSAEELDNLVREFSDFKREFAYAERPAHRVRISRPFYMGQNEVTLKQFLTFYHEAKYKCECQRDGKGGRGYDASKKEFGQKPEYRPWSWGFSDQTQDHPVVNVTWNDAKAFCAWLSEKEGRKYRLPTEAEWEYACRARTTTRHPGGNETRQLAKIANIADQSVLRILGAEKIRIAEHDDRYGFTAPGGSYSANDFGLYDMIGNCCEWCEDVFDPEAYKTRVGTTSDPLVTTGSDHRVSRGGSWDVSPEFARSALRFGGTPGDRGLDTGFRVVLESVGVRSP